MTRLSALHSAVLSVSHCVGTVIAGLQVQREATEFSLPRAPDGGEGDSGRGTALKTAGDTVSAGGEPLGSPSKRKRPAAEALAGSDAGDGDEGHVNASGGDEGAGVTTAAAVAVEQLERLSARRSAARTKPSPDDELWERVPAKFKAPEQLQSLKTLLQKVRESDMGVSLPDAVRALGLPTIRTNECLSVLLKLGVIERQALPTGTRYCRAGPRAAKPSVAKKRKTK